MDTKIRLQADLKEFLRLFSSNRVDYLLIGGYAVGYYGYPRPTGDLDVWVEMNPQNANRIVTALSEFGFAASPELFLKENSVVRMGIRPFQVEILTTIDGVGFRDCYERRNTVEIDGVEVSVIDLSHLLVNKKASGRLKDLNDVEQLSNQ